MTQSPASPAVFQDRIREGLLRKAGLTAAQIEEALRTERETGQQLDQVLIGKNFLPEGKCLQFFGELLGLEFRPSLEGVGVPSVFIQQIPVQFARTHGLIAIEDTGSLIVANTPEQFAAQIAAEYEVYKKVVAQQKLKLE